MVGHLCQLEFTLVRFQLWPIARIGNFAARLKCEADVSPAEEEVLLVKHTEFESPPVGRPGVVLCDTLDRCLNLCGCRRVIWDLSQGGRCSANRRHFKNSICNIIAKKTDEGISSQGKFAPCRRVVREVFGRWFFNTACREPIAVYMGL